MKRRRVPRIEAINCTCRPGPVAAKEHAKPGAMAPEHFGKCTHSMLEETTRPLPPPQTVARIRLLP